MLLGLIFKIGCGLHGAQRRLLISFCMFDPRQRSKPLHFNRGGPVVTLFDLSLCVLNGG